MKICPSNRIVRVLLPHGSGWNSGSEIKAVHNGNGSVSFTRGKLVPIQKNRYRREAKATESSVIATPDICCTRSWIFSHFSCSFSITTGADLRYTHTHTHPIRDIFVPLFSIFFHARGAKWAIFRQPFEKMLFFSPRRFVSIRILIFL